MVAFQQNKRGFIEYNIDVNNVIFRLQFPRVVQCAGHLYGDVAEMLVEELITKGRVPASVLISTTTDQVNEALKAQGAQEIQPSFVREKLERLAMTHFIKRCNLPSRDANGKVVSLTPCPKHLMFVIPAADIEGKKAGVKRDMESDGATPAKRAKIADDLTPENLSDSQVYVEVNYARFLHYFRDQAIVAAVATRLDNEKATEIVRTILRHCEKTTNPTDEVTKPVTFHEIQAQLPRDHGFSKHSLEQWLKILTDNMPEFITKTADSGGGMYSINIFQALKSLCLAHIESTVQERFGSKALRIFRVIHLKKHVEQMTIEKCVLMPAKDMKELLYRMFFEQFVHVTHLPKTPDYAPSRTFYLFNIEVYKVTRMLLHRAYTSIKNIRIKRLLVSADNRRLLDKEERVQAVLNSLKPQLDNMEEDERKQEVQSIEENITPSERQQLTEAKGTKRHLEASEQQLVSIVALMENYIAFTYRPPLEKPPKDLLADM